MVSNSLFGIPMLYLQDKYTGTADRDDIDLVRAGTGMAEYFGLAPTETSENCPTFNPDEPLHRLSPDLFTTFQWLPNNRPVAIQGTVTQRDTGSGYRVRKPSTGRSPVACTGRAF